MAVAHRSSTVFQFFKIICDDNISDGRIRLPNAFTSRYEWELPNPVIFKVAADGTQWRVRWTRRDDAIWFENGWKGFAEHYSISHWHMVLFKYQVMTSHFEVCIFDMSTTEIDYHRDPNLQQAQEYNGRARRIPANPSFELRIKSSYVKGRCVDVPEMFANRYLNEGPVHLKVGGRSWLVVYKVWGDADGNRRDWKYKLQRGWAAFRRENHLKVGDVCVFVLTNMTRATFEVQIIRAGFR